MTSWVDRLWYSQRKPLWLLYPLTWLYRAISENRRRKAWSRKDDPIPVPVVVVGNITAGGTGKSPLTASLVRLLKDNGWSPVILTRGYGGRSQKYPLLVEADTGAATAGDEPVMLFEQTGCPVVVDPDRRKAALWALERKLGTVFICDDGLQHYRLARDIELAVFDGQRGIGNGALIPVGPLREDLGRLRSVDFVLVNGGTLDVIKHDQQYTMNLKPIRLRNLATGEERSVDDLSGQTVVAVAGIGNPQRFFNTLRRLGAQVIERPKPDHHRLSPDELVHEPGQWLLMTAKDAVKCPEIASADAWVLEVEAELPEDFNNAFLSAVSHSREALATI